MKLYVVIKDDGGEYEDYHEWIDKIFVIKEKAQKYIKTEKRKKENKIDRWGNKIGFRIEEHELIGDVKMNELHKEKVSDENE